MQSSAVKSPSQQLLGPVLWPNSSDSTYIQIRSCTTDDPCPSTKKYSIWSTLYSLSCILSGGPETRAGQGSRLQLAHQLNRSTRLVEIKYVSTVVGERHGLWTGSRILTSFLVGMDLLRIKPDSWHWHWHMDRMERTFVFGPIYSVQSTSYTTKPLVSNANQSKNATEKEKNNISTYSSFQIVPQRHILHAEYDLNETKPPHVATGWSLFLSLPPSLHQTLY